MSSTSGRGSHAEAIADAEESHAHVWRLQRPQDDAERLRQKEGLLTDTPHDRAFVTATRQPGSVPHSWELALGVHLHVGRAPIISDTGLRVWLHEKTCRTRHSPSQLKGILSDYSDGRCAVCGALPLRYQALAPVREGWTHWVLRKCGLDIQAGGRARTA